MVLLFLFPESLLAENLLCLSVELLLGVLLLLIGPCDVCVTDLALGTLSDDLHEVVLVPRSDLIRLASLDLELLSVLSRLLARLLYKKLNSDAKEV